MRDAELGVDPESAARTIVAILSPSKGGRVRTGAGAIFTIAGQTGGVIGFVARMLSPRPVSMLFEPGYRLFARHRGRFARFFKDPE